MQWAFGTRTAPTKRLHTLYAGIAGSCLCKSGHRTSGGRFMSVIRERRAVPPSSLSHENFQSIELSGRTAPRLAHLFLAILILGSTPRPAAAHAVLVESTPAAKSTTSGPSIVIRLRFNARIDAGRSIIILIRKNGSSSKLQTIKQPEPNTLTATATGMRAGNYLIRWQVLAPDGHITSGEIPFSVGGS
jgi:methionine-rich copper-binding protein CopC